MIKRNLIFLENSRLLSIDPFLIEYLGLNETNSVDIKIENNTIVISKSQPDDSNNNEPIQTISKSKSHYIKDFFKDGRLKVGDIVVYYQAVDEGKANADDIDIQAVIALDANGNRKYLKYKKDNKLYSFSGLRRKLIHDYDLKDVHPDWVFHLTDEWGELKSNKRLSEL